MKRTENPNLITANFDDVIANAKNIRTPVQFVGVFVIGLTFLSFGLIFFFIVGLDALHDPVLFILSAVSLGIIAFGIRSIAKAATRLRSILRDKVR